MGGDAVTGPAVPDGPYAAAPAAGYGADVPPDPMVPMLTPAPGPTGHAGVDEAVGRLTDLGEFPVTEHVAIFDEAHRLLQDALADLDED